MHVTCEMYLSFFTYRLQLANSQMGYPNSNEYAGYLA